MTTQRLFAGIGAFVSCAAALGAACSSANPEHILLYTDAGGLAPSSDGSVIANDAGQALRSFTPPADPGAGSVWVTISGEASALAGYPFPPADWVNDTYFVDGWDFIIEEYIVTIDHVVLWSNPNRSPTNQGDLTGMAQVAHLDGPFVVDLHRGGPIVGQGGSPEQAVAIGVIASQNDHGNASFDPTTTYGFGFSTVPATYDAYNVNLSADEAADFAAMVQNGYSVFYRGHLTWQGARSPFGCVATSAGPRPGAGLLDAADGSFDFTKMPNAGIGVALGFSTPTNYVNCQNMTLHGTPNAGENYPRGIQISTSQSAIAQLTVHMDHPFWESFAEGSPVHFDQIAAQFVGATNPVAHVEDLRGVPFYAFIDKTGTPLPWRNCAGPSYTPPGNGQMSFDTLSVPVDPHATCTGTIGDDFTKDNCPAERDYYDYMRFTQSTQGHLNSQGLCFIDRRWPAPAGGS
jgi:hypothetical protein